MHGSPGIASTHPQGEGPLRTPFYFEVIRAQGGYLVLVSKWPAEPTLELASLVLAYTVLTTVLFLAQVSSLF